jgi:hypothetical protein
MYDRRMARSAPLALLAGLLLVGAACSDGGSSDGGGVPSTGGQAAPATSPSVGVPDIVNFTAPAVGGGEVDVAALAARPLAIWFWAPT